MNQAAWTAHKEAVRRAEARRNLRELVLGILFGLAAVALVWLGTRGS